MKTAIILLFVSFTALGQFKIGEISVPDDVAVKYFNYLYTHPDTVRAADPWEMIGHGEGYPKYFGPNVKRTKPSAKTVQESRKQDSIKWLKNKRGTSISSWTSYNANDLDKAKIRAEEINANILLNKIATLYEQRYGMTVGYVVPKAATEGGFIKWMVSNSPKP